MSSSLTKYLLDQIKWLGYDIDIEACRTSAKDQASGELPPADECMTRQSMLQLAAEHTRVSYHRANELALEGI